MGCAAVVMAGTDRLLHPTGSHMRSARTPLPNGLDKAPTGIIGLDDITSGGLPHGRTTVLVGGPGSGKTIFALQFLAHGAQRCREPGIFVAFEESPKRILANTAGFDWKLAALQGKKKLFFLDAHPLHELIQSGDFDLSGMLAALDAKVKEMKALRIVFDALDIVLELLPNEATKRREIYRLHAWLLANGLTGIITLKAGGESGSTVGRQPFDYMQFMVDCAVLLNHNVAQGVSQRNLRVQKYRGSDFDENESPFLIGKNGLDVAVSHTQYRAATKVTKERVSSGVQRLDTMLGGGYYRASAVLITGMPGTAKTTLGGAFAEAACTRGERTLFISFDSDAGELARNLTSVGIRLARYLKRGLLRLISARTISGSAESYLVHIKMLATEHKARCLVIDPVSALFVAGNELTAHNVAERLIDWAKAEGITLLCTSLLDTTSPADKSTAVHISTLADTWIHLNYLVQAGERNRGLSIIKSRGMAHSNQVRELILSDDGVTLTDAYSSGGEVLMGTLRWEKERIERIGNEDSEATSKLKRIRLDAEEAELAVRVKLLQVELSAKQAEKALLDRTTANHAGNISQGRRGRRELRGADRAARSRK